MKNVERQAQDVIDGRLDAMQDAPSPDLAAEVRRRYSDRYEDHVGLETQFAFLNTVVAPFDDARVREAAIRAVDRRSIGKLPGGRLSPGCSMLPPPIPSYEEPDPCPVGDPAAAPDLGRARQLVRAAGAEGERVRVWGARQEPSQSIVIAFSVCPQTVGSRKTRRRPAT